MVQRSESVAKVPQVAATRTQRAYTLRLRGIDPLDSSWRDALWATHEAINNGAKVFGDWLLTLRGGLSHELADQKVMEGKGASKQERDPKDDERRDRRVLLALSWLSVESAPRDKDDPRKPFLIGAANGPTSREQALREALRGILQKRDLSASEIGEPNVEPENQPHTWLGQCGPSLAARIREDAVWVNRSAMFDAVTSGWQTQGARRDAHTLLSFILSDEFLTLPTARARKKESETAENDDGQEELRKAVKASSRGAGQRTRHPFSHLLGEGKPFGKPQRKLTLRDQWHAYLKPRLEAVGLPLDARTSNKGKRKDAAPAHTELQREMFSKAASRVAQIVTKQRQQEADRLARKEADAELRHMEADHSYDGTLSALREYCDAYRVTSGATGEFMIRPRQITGWERVVKRWAAITEADADAASEARIAAVKETQEADEENKFGDPNLFFRLADAKYVQVWRRNGGPDPTILERFVKGMKARSDSERLKVAAFRHPDPYFNPIFCQFGVSRPAIHFRRLKAFSDSPAGDDPRAVGMLLWHPAAKSAKITLLYGVSQRLDREIGSACEQVQQNAEGLHSVSRRGRLGAAAAGLASADVPARVAGVFDLKRIKSRATDDGEEENEDVVGGNGKLKEPKWNGTLSTNRRDLTAIANLIEKEDAHKAERRRKQLRWTLTVSMEMEGRGPWFRYIAAAPESTPFLRSVRKNEDKGLRRTKGTRFVEAEGWPWQEFNKPLKDNKGGAALVEDAKAARGDKACLILSRLPGLRVLSLDLGHRFAASCAVWEAISAQEMVKACREHGHRAPRESDVFIHLVRTVKKGRKKGRDKGKTVDVAETTIYRRIGSDRVLHPLKATKVGDCISLPVFNDHPAPWAQLDRQFFIKLQGEERPARAATNGKLKDGSPTETNEVEMVAALSRDLGVRQGDADGAISRGVDELMRRAVRIATLGLKRHGRMAKIAYAFKPDCPGIPGMGGAIKAITRVDDHVQFITNALADWHALFTDTEWDGSAARQLWNKHIKPVQGGFEVAEPTPPDPNAERPTRQQRRKSEEELRDRLKPIAEHFANANAECSRHIHDAWAKLWTVNDGIERKSLSDPARSDFAHTPIRDESGKVIGSRTAPKEGKETPGGWHARIRLLTDWIMGSRLPGAQSTHWNRNVGGLSLTRIATMRSLYQLHKGFAMRPRPDNVRGAPEKGESNAGVAQSILDAMERMREQRVKQIASRIVEAALGVGIEHDRVWDDEKQKWRFPKRPRCPIFHRDGKGDAHGDPRFKTCHAVVIENLRNYRPDELQTRRENRALMNWSAGKVRKYLEEACQLHGLHLREVMPNYTSRQCSRTGLPGLRCMDGSVDPKTGEPTVYWWKKALAAAKKKVGNDSHDEKKGDAESRYIVALADHLAKLKSEDKPLPKTVRVPRKGGDLFIAAPANGAASADERPRAVLQADVNAAANIGLRALLDPDFPGKWWYVPCDTATGRPAQDKCKGSACLNPESPLLQAASEAEGANGRKRKSAQGPREKTNAWRDVGDSGAWRVHAQYWNDVKARVVAELRNFNGLTRTERDDPIGGENSPW